MMFDENWFKIHENEWKAKKMNENQRNLKTKINWNLNNCENWSSENRISRRLWGAARQKNQKKNIKSFFWNRLNYWTPRQTGHLDQGTWPASGRHPAGHRKYDRLLRRVSSWKNLWFLWGQNTFHRAELLTPSLILIFHSFKMMCMPFLRDSVPCI